MAQGLKQLNKEALYQLARRNPREYEEYTKMVRQEVEEHNRRMNRKGER